MGNDVHIIKNDQSTGFADKAVKVRTREGLLKNHRIFRVLWIQRQLMSCLIERDQVASLQKACPHFFSAFWTVHFITSAFLILVIFKFILSWMSTFFNVQ